MNNENNRITYSNFYVAFLDVLGFKKLVLSNKKDDKQKIEDYFNIVEKETTELKKIDIKRDLGSIIISDSVILTLPVGETNDKKIENLRQLCVAVGKVQYALALKNIWVRGAISNGDAYFNSSKNQVVGPAYIRAFFLEEEQAIYPRVILDNKIIKALRMKSAQELIEIINKKYEGGLHYTNWGNDILYDWAPNEFAKKDLNKDVALFIDFLQPMFFKPIDMKAIVDNINKSMYLRNSIYSKFRWVVDYLISNLKYYINNPTSPNYSIDDILVHKYYDKLRKY